MIESGSSSLADVFPLIRSAGLFLILVGAAMAVGASAMKRRYLALAIGAAIGTAATALSAMQLSAPYGSPDALQLGSLAAAILFEVLAIAFVGPAVAKRGERFKTIAILGIVAAHFVIMAPAFGPPIVALGLLTAGNALLGAIAPKYPLPAIWLLDGLLKLAAGAAMFFAHLLPALS